MLGSKQRAVVLNVQPDVLIAREYCRCQKYQRVQSMSGQVKTKNLGAMKYKVHFTLN